MLNIEQLKQELEKLLTKKNWLEQYEEFFGFTEEDEANYKKITARIAEIENTLQELSNKN